MKEILVRGPVLSNSGYGVHSRQVARWLIERNSNVVFQVLPWGDTSWLLNDDLENGLIREIFKRTNFNQKDRKSTRLNSSHVSESRMPSSA